MKEPKAGVARILKPNLGFEALFEGTIAANANDDTTEKIPFFEWADRLPPTSVRDPLAGKTGFDPNLLAYVPVPKGATIQLFIPYIPNAGLFPYRYWVSFRDMSLAYSNALTLQGQGSQSHIPYQAFGVQDTSVNPDADRYVINAGLHSVGVHQPEPASWYVSGGTRTLSQKLANELALHPEPLVPRQSYMRACLIAAGVRGIHQQGVLDPATASGYAGASAGTWFELVAQGDQMLIAADRLYTGYEGATPSTSANWTFGDPDSDIDGSFGASYGYPVNPAGDPVPEFGIYLYVIEH